MWLSVRRACALVACASRLARAAALHSEARCTCPSFPGPGLSAETPVCHAALWPRRFQEEEDAADYVTQLATDLHVYPPHMVLEGPFYYEGFDPQLVGPGGEVGVREGGRQACLLCCLCVPVQALSWCCATQRAPKLPALLAQAPAPRALRHRSRSCWGG